MRARSHALVAEAVFEGAGGGVRALRLTLDAAQYPDDVEDATLTVRWFENDEYSFHYRERHRKGNRPVWQCRWDRHPNPHAGYEHFHEPPDAGHDRTVEDHVVAPHPTEMFTRTMANVRDRIAALWE